MGLSPNRWTSLEDGVLYLDACILIYLVEGFPSYRTVLWQLWEGLQSGRFHACTSEISLLETCVAPLRVGDSALLARYEALHATSRIKYVPISSSVLRRAAQLRADDPSLRTPDAIHLGTALDQRCKVFLTNDSRLASMNDLQVLQLANIP